MEEGANEDKVFNAYSQNLNKAIARLESEDQYKAGVKAAKNEDDGRKQEKIEAKNAAAKKELNKEPQMSNAQLLEATKIDDSESMEDRKKRLQEHMDMLIEAKNKEREDEFLNTQQKFFKLADDKFDQNEALERQRTQEWNKLQEQLDRRKVKKMIK